MTRPVKRAREPWLRFRVGESSYALPLRHIAEVTETRSRYLIPGTPFERAGIINLRGEPLPVVDGARLLGDALGVHRHAIVLEFERKRVGMLVAAISKIEHDAEPPEPETSPTEPDASETLLGFSQRAGERVGWIDIGALQDRLSEILGVRTPEGEAPCP